jgi:phosphodiesterase/alkaline phosphatase D-like protein
MSRCIPIFAFAAISACLVLVRFQSLEVIAAAPPSRDAAQIIAGPELETATDTLAIIRWTTTNPGGTDLHYGIVHYGTNAKDLSQVAKSPNRRNPSHPDMTFRVRISGLNPQTTYYYTVESAGSTDVNDGVSSPVKTFKTK